MPSTNISDEQISKLKPAAPRPILEDGADNWNKMPYQVKIGETFATLADSIRYTLNVDKGKLKYSGTSEDFSDNTTLAINAGYPSDINYIGAPYFMDTRLGANDAINCLWQFNRDDDIVHESMKSDLHEDCGMGRVYANTLEKNKTIAWFSFGVAKFTSLATFYQRAFKKELIQLNNTGFSSVSLGSLFGAGFALTFALPILGVNWLYNWMIRLQDYKVDRFYDLRTTMHLYYSYVDSMMAEWLVNTGLYGNGGGSQTSWTADPEMLPISIRETGPSIWDIIARKSKLLAQNAARNSGSTQGDILNTEKFYSELKRLTAASYFSEPGTESGYDWDSDNVWSNNNVDFTKNIWRTALGATQFVGFRIEKNVDASESFSNSTAPSSFAEQINGQIAEARSKAFDLGQAGGGSNTGIGAVDAIADFAKGAFSSLSSAVKLDGLAEAVTGGAFIDIPEQYKSSDFNKSHSLNFQFRAPYGDIVSIYQSVMVPLFMILAGCLPRAAGTNAYQQPFLCRVYCKGMFSIPLGIIDSVSVKRGSSEFGWTFQNLPTCIDVSVSIKDMSPIMYMAMNNSTFQSILGTNNSYKEYMLTLAGTGLWDRVSRMSQIRRNVQIISHKVRNRLFNPNFWSNMLGNSAVALFAASFSPSTFVSQERKH